MKITSELNLQSFDFWSGAKEHNFTYLQRVYWLQTGKSIALLP